MFATVLLESEILPSCLLVPKDALLVRDQRTLVFIAQRGLAKWQYVEVGEENERFIEIRSGILVGDTVIVGGHYTLSHDAKVAKVD
jgi:multidrug efflux pump subunit AcrA (membrane-fusion protein)